MTKQQDEPEINIERQLAEMESRLKALEDGANRSSISDDSESTSPDRLWAVDVLGRRKGEPFQRKDTRGSLLYAGSVVSPGTGSVAWQIERPAPLVLDTKWENAAPILASLGHPVRLEIIRRLLTGARTSQELQEIADLRTTGRLYHHLRDLLESGVIVSPRRNHYAIPAAKIVPCLIIVAAASELASQVSVIKEDEQSSSQV